MTSTAISPSSSTRARYPSLDGRSVLITGGATGIGASLVEAFVAQGARVAFIDLDEGAGATLADRLAAQRTAPLFVAADLTDTAALHAAIDIARRRLGPITVLLNNAANDQRHSIDDDAGVLGRRYRRQPEASVFCVAGGVAGHEADGWRLDRQLRFGQLDAQAGRHAGVHHGQVSGSGADAQPGA